MRSLLDRNIQSRQCFHVHHLHGGHLFTQHFDSLRQLLGWSSERCAKYVLQRLFGGYLFPLRLFKLRYLRCWDIRFQQQHPLRQLPRWHLQFWWGHCLRGLPCRELLERLSTLLSLWIGLGEQRSGWVLSDVRSRHL
jgi:hypothetical protein